MPFFTSLPKLNWLTESPKPLNLKGLKQALCIIIHVPMILILSLLVQFNGHHKVASHKNRKAAISGFLYSFWLAVFSLCLGFGFALCIS